MIIIVITRMRAPDLSVSVDEYFLIYRHNIDREWKTRRDVALSSIVIDRGQSIPSAIFKFSS